MPDRQRPAVANGFQSSSALLIIDSFAALTGRPLVDGLVGADSAGEKLYHAPFVVLAHDTASDPVFFYANLAAQELFELDWPQFVALPSRLSAEPLAREERARLLARVSRDGYIDDYAGIRISASGRRFRITGATVWNLIAAGSRYQGQAAMFSRWARC